MSLNDLVEKLKDRELEIIHLMAEGASNQQIADKLYISTNTVRWYNKQIYHKFGVNSRIKVVNLAREWGLLEEDALRFIEEKKGHLINLPQYANRFIGREEDLAQGQKILLNKQLITVTGPAGIGKSRFAVQLAHWVADNYMDGVCFVPLASLTDADFVPKMVATQLCLIEDMQQSAAETVTRHLMKRDILLILDNFEHVMDAAVYVKTWLNNCPDLTILITSREVLHWQSEQVYHLKPLSHQLSPTITTKTETYNEAIQLFIERGRSYQFLAELSPENIHIVGKICEKLEGLPLSIELAAARSDMFTPQIILKQLANRLQFLVDGPQDLPPRQRSLRSALAWSFDLLNQSEQILLRRLGIFRGGFALDSVEAICLVDVKLGIVDGLASLLRQSLINVFEDMNAEPRFQMLETIQEYAYEKLVEANELGQLQNDHANYYLKLAEQAYSERNTNRQKYWINRANLEIDNLRLSLKHLYHSKQAGTGLRILSGFYWCFRRSGFLLEAVDWYAQFLDLEVFVPSEIKAHALICFGDLVQRTGKENQALELHKSAVQFARNSQDKTLIGLALGMLAGHRTFMSDNDQTILDMAYEAHCYFEQANDLALISWIENMLGELYRFQEDYTNANQHYQIALEIAEEMQDANRIATVLQNLSVIAILQKDFSLAVDLCLQTLQHVIVSKNPNSVVGVLISMANLLAELAFYEDSAQILGMVDLICTQYKFAVDKSDIPLFNQTLKCLQFNLSENFLEQYRQQIQPIEFDEIVNNCINVIERIQIQISS